MDFGTVAKSDQTGTTMSTFQVNTAGSLSPTSAFIRGDTSSCDEAKEEGYDSPTLGGSPVTPIKEKESIWGRIQNSKATQAASLP
jgi:hypothetical protein